MATERTLTVYRRSGCHLCDEMIAGLRELQTRFCFKLQVVDVDSDPALEQLYGEKVPLLAHGEQALCQYVLELPAVTAYLAGNP